MSSIEKALAILMAFTQGNREMGTVELSRKLGYHSATVSRILQVLKQQGFLQPDPRTRKFTLGPSAFELGKTMFRFFNRNLLNIAMPCLEDLGRAVGETVVFEVMSGKNPVVTYIGQGTRSLSVIPNIGDTVPIHVSPGAKAIIAFSDPETVDGLLDTDMRSFTPYTITDKERLKAQLSEIAIQGVAFCRQEMAIGVNAIGAPIFNDENKAVGAVVVAGLASRVRCSMESSMVAALKETACEISARLFHGPSMEMVKKRRGGTT